MPGEPWRQWCRDLGAAAVDGLQVRCKGLSDRHFLALAAEACSEPGRPEAVLVNARFDIALAANAAGVHLPASGLPIERVRVALTSGSGRRPLVGRSTHTPQEVRLAHDQGADYVVFGPVFDTPSKLGRIPPRGLDALEEAVAFGVPVLALGGIDDSNAQQVLERGAWGLAAIRWFAQPALRPGRFDSLQRNWPAA